MLPTLAVSWRASAARNEEARQFCEVAGVSIVNCCRLSACCLASSPGHSQILSRSRGEKSGEGLGAKYVTTGVAGMGDPHFNDPRLNNPRNE